MFLCSVSSFLTNNRSFVFFFFLGTYPDEGNTLSLTGDPQRLPLGEHLGATESGDLGLSSLGQTPQLPPGSFSAAHGHRHGAALPVAARRQGDVLDVFLEDELHTVGWGIGRKSI